MKLGNTFTLVIGFAGLVGSQSVNGIYDLLSRRLPQHAKSFEFCLGNVTDNGNATKSFDSYAVSSGQNGTTKIQGQTLSAISYGLHRYIKDVLHLDIYWTGSRLHLAPSPLPRPNRTLTGSSTVQWRYHFNTVTFSYTTAFWSWEDWELELDWLALHGVNLALAWVGQEKILVEVFREFGFTDQEIGTYLSGPAFEAWQRFGNIQGSWGGALPMSWVDSQFALQRKIVERMTELGITPVLPAFTGFVPRSLRRVLPNATFVNGSQWNNFPVKYTNTTFLEPFDPNFTRLQERFIRRQALAYGNVTHIYTLDQYNENDPYSGDLSYLRNVTENTWRSLKAADPQAVWLMQGWLFSSNADFWTNERIEAYLSGVPVNSDMLILDLFSESSPQWQRTNSYFGKPWIWCELHDYGGNMGIYGQVQNVTTDPVEALQNSSSLVGFGLTPEGQEGNEVMYTLLLDQAWSRKPVETNGYFQRWVQVRYSYSGQLPPEIYAAWDLLRTTAYNNTNLTSNAVTKSIFELAPNITGLLGRTGHHPTTINYDPAQMVEAWSLLYRGANRLEALWENPVFLYDMTDVSRQVLANAFDPVYLQVVATWMQQNATASAVREAGAPLLKLLSDLDEVLYTNENFLLSTWIRQARAWADNSTALAAFYEYNARNQITLWGPHGEINDYASKSWAGLVSSYYLKRWAIFVDYLAATPAPAFNATHLSDRLLGFSETWQTEQWGLSEQQPFGTRGELPVVLSRIQQQWPAIFH